MKANFTVTIGIGDIRRKWPKLTEHACTMLLHDLANSKSFHQLLQDTAVDLVDNWISNRIEEDNNE